MLRAKTVRAASIDKAKLPALFNGKFEDADDSVKDLFEYAFVHLSLYVSKELSLHMKHTQASLTIDQFRALFNLSDEAFVLQIVEVFDEYLSGRKAIEFAASTNKTGRPKGKPNLDGTKQIFLKHGANAKKRREKPAAMASAQQNTNKDEWYEHAVEELNSYSSKTSSAPNAGVVGAAAGEDEEESFSFASLVARV